MFYISMFYISMFYISMFYINTQKKGYNEKLELSFIRRRFNG